MSLQGETASYVLRNELNLLRQVKTISDKLLKNPGSLTKVDGHVSNFIKNSSGGRINDDARTISTISTSNFKTMVVNLEKDLKELRNILPKLRRKL